MGTTVPKEVNRKLKVLAAQRGMTLKSFLAEHLKELVASVP